MHVRVGAIEEISFLHPWLDITCIFVHRSAGVIASCHLNGFNKKFHFVMHRAENCIWSNESLPFDCPIWKYVCAVCCFSIITRFISTILKISTWIILFYVNKMLLNDFSIHWGPPTDAMCHAWNIYRHKVHPFIKSILTKRDGNLALGNGERHKDTHRTHTHMCS